MLHLASYLDSLGCAVETVLTKKLFQNHRVVKKLLIWIREHRPDINSGWVLSLWVNWSL
jgi:hypothetical protein